MLELFLGLTTNMYDSIKNYNKSLGLRYGVSNISNGRKLFYKFVIRLNKRVIKKIKEERKYISSLQKFCDNLKEFVKIPHIERCKMIEFCEHCKKEYESIGIKYNIGHIK